MKLLKNGLIYDGTGSEAYVADILVDGEKIVKVGNNVPDYRQ